MSAAQREASHRAEHAGRSDDGDECEEEETEGDVIMGARSRPEDALDAGDFASLLGGEDEEGVEQAQAAAAEPSVEEQAAQEESDLQSALRDSEAMALGLPPPRPTPEPICKKLIELALRACWMTSSDSAHSE